jgi:hypothetical protein
MGGGKYNADTARYRGLLRIYAKKAQFVPVSSITGKE